MGYQSAGRTPEPWLGPDVGTVIDELAASPGATGIVVCPLGFVADHLEVLYDLDIEAQHTAATCGVTCVRAKTVGTHPAFLTMLSELIAARVLRG